MYGTNSRLRRGSYGLLFGVLFACATITSPVVHADPQQQCNKTVGDSVNDYLNEHPDVRQQLAAKGEQEAPGSPNPVLEYLNRHPDVRQHLITLSQQCTS